MKDNFIRVENVEYIYRSGHDTEIVAKKALSDVSVTIQKGQFVAIIGRNGSGKSTFARLLNALLVPSSGAIYIKGMHSGKNEHVWEIRHTCGMVFQNPDNQIIGTTVEEDAAFGPENLGVEPGEIRKRVEEALEMVGIRELAKHAPHLLSGGQKQRVAIAGILAMKPECILLDEATAMLDPVGRREVIKVLHKLNKEEGITVIHITHHMDEASEADRVIIVDKGNMVLDGKPYDVFSRVRQVKELGLDVPQVTELFHELNKEGFHLPEKVISVEEAIRCLKDTIQNGK